MKKDAIKIIRVEETSVGHLHRLLIKEEIL